MSNENENPEFNYNEFLKKIRKCWETRKYDILSVYEMMELRRITPDFRSFDLRGKDLRVYTPENGRPLDMGLYYLKGAMWDDNTIWPEGFENFIDWDGTYTQYCEDE